MTESLYDFLQDYVLSVAVSHDGEWVVSGSKDRGVQFWDAKTGIVQCMLQVRPRVSARALFETLTSFSNRDTKIRVSPWNSIPLPIIDRFLVISIDLSPAGNVLATGSGDWHARICPFLSLPFPLKCDTIRSSREL